MNDSRFSYANAAAVILLSAAIIGALALVVNQNQRLNEATSEIERLGNDLQRVEAGAAASALQVQAMTLALADAAPGINAGLDEAITGLDEFATSTIVVDIDVDELVPIETSFVLDRELVVPIQTTIPIDETIATTITIAGPLGTEIPLDVTVPIEIDFPVDIDLPIAVNETIPVSTRVPIAVTVPVQIPVADTELAAMANSLRDGLTSLQQILLALGGA